MIDPEKFIYHKTHEIRVEKVQGLTHPALANLIRVHPGLSFRGVFCREILKRAGGFERGKRFLHRRLRLPPGSAFEMTENRPFPDEL